jgi:hypothetical protein
MYKRATVFAFVAGLLLSAGAYAVTLPRPAGEVPIMTPNGQVLLSSYKGKIVILAFILST